MAVITISKEYGTDSEKVAKLAAEKLGYEYVGKQLVAKIAEELNISETEAELFSQASSSGFLRHIDRFTCTMVKKVVDGDYGCLDDVKYYESTKKFVESLYEDGNVIIVGWGGQCVLKKKPNTLHVRLRKEEDKKIEVAMQQKKIGEKEAQKLVKKEEENFKSYLKQFFNADWNDAGLYDLVIDMGEVSIEKAADLICENMRIKFE